MGTQLTQILQFLKVNAGQTATLPHNINVNGRALVPDLVMQDNAYFRINSVTSSEVTVTNLSSSQQTCHVWLEFKHTHDRWFGAKQIEQLSPAPFIAGGGIGPSGVRVLGPVSVSNEALVNPSTQILTTAPMDVPASRKFVFQATLWIEGQAFPAMSDREPCQVNMQIVVDPGGKGQSVITETTVRAEAILFEGDCKLHQSLACQGAFSGDDNAHTFGAIVNVAPNPAPMAFEFSVARLDLLILDVPTAA